MTPSDTLQRRTVRPRRESEGRQGRRPARALPMSPAVFRAVRTAHIVVSVGWLGIVIGKLVLGLDAILTDDPRRVESLLTAMEATNVAFPPVAIATLVTGVLLSLGTRWGLLRYYWVATKLALTLAVIISAVQLADPLVRWVASTGPGAPGQLTLPTGLLLSLTVSHLVMLAVATVLSVYRPWGRTWFGRCPS